MYASHRSIKTRQSFVLAACAAVLLAAFEDELQLMHPATDTVRVAAERGNIAEAFPDLFRSGGSGDCQGIAAGNVSHLATAENRPAKISVPLATTGRHCRSIRVLLSVWQV